MATMKFALYQPMTKNQLLAVMPNAKHRLTDEVVGYLNMAAERYQIATPARKAAFIAQLAHESGELKYVRELASGAAYEGRTDLGNSQPGDGVKFAGRGYIQCTGRANYEWMAEELGIDCVNKPELLELPLYAALVSGAFWKKEHLNTFCDSGDFRRLTKEINGGYTHLERRVEYWLRGIPVFAGIRLEPRG